MSQQGNGLDTEDQASVQSVRSIQPSPDTLTKLVRRIRTLTLTLLPVEVPVDSISDPTSRVITPQVVKAYIAAAGDLVEALPYCLLRARKEFMWDANHNPADYEENIGRATACEVLARRVIHVSPADRIATMMSTRFTHRELDGDASDKTSALEMAIDSHCTIFLSSTEAQEVVNDLWKGNIIQKHNEDHDLDFVFYRETLAEGFWNHMDPSRLAVPRHQNIFRIIVWIFFLFVYSQAVREPLDRLDPNHEDLDFWEIIMYILALSFAFEDVQKISKLLICPSSCCIYTAHYGHSLARSYEQHQLTDKELPKPQFCRAFDMDEGHTHFRRIQIRRHDANLRSPDATRVWHILLGFIQGMYALDAADGHTDYPHEVINLLIQALLQAPDYSRWEGWAPGLFLYYMWNVATVVILLNILISLFSSAYDDVVEDAAAEYLAYFADKTVSMIRAPDEYLYPAPFSLIEFLLIAPTEYFVSKETYRQFNRIVMSVLFFIPLLVIGIYETELDPSKNKWVKDWLSHPDQGLDDAPEARDPVVDGEDGERGLKISTISFDDLVKVFPDTTHSSEAVMLREIGELKKQIQELKELILEKQGS
ncbi:hypothetical protein NM688_g1867 [Phlebia brevispora]|uniref:Uncharacterized protein n=1 Tax=Phlebia brevispora TaxID=194682 RepID=A0ACC1TAH1_9APHY|nr:hypothetical protein NM688_g1867 [Phlebia brevispora]